MIDLHTHDAEGWTAHPRGKAAVKIIPYNRAGGVKKTMRMRLCPWSKALFPADVQNPTKIERLMQVESRVVPTKNAAC
jgi:hypothetical protein